MPGSVLYLPLWQVGSWGIDGELGAGSKFTCVAAGYAGCVVTGACPWRHGASGEPPARPRGEVFVTPGDNTGDEHGWLRWAGAFPFLVILVFLFLAVSSMWVFLHNSHSTGFHGGRVSSFSL